MTEFQKKYPCPIDGCESRAASHDYLDQHIRQEHGEQHLAMHKFFMALGEQSARETE